MHQRLKRIVDFLLGEPDTAPPVKPREKSVPPSQKVPVANDQTAEFYKEFLMRIYPCSKPFDVVVIHTKPKTRMGTYNPRTRRIRINDGWGDAEHCKETASSSCLPSRKGCTIIRRRLYRTYSPATISSTLMFTLSTRLGDCLMSTSEDRLRKKPHAASRDRSLYRVAVTLHPSWSFSMCFADVG